MSGPTLEGADSDPVVGHKTINTGEIGEFGLPVFRHEPLRKSEADAILQACDEADRKRAEAMPTEKDAVNALWEAQQRLKELGWKDPTYAHELKQEGVESQLIELGSSGIHVGYYHKTGEHDVWWIGGEGCPSTPCLVKSFAKAPPP